MTEPDVCVVYLAWAPAGIEPVRAFVDSYRRHRPGIEHRLVVALKGYDTSERLAAVRRELGDLPCEEVRADPSLLDLATYRTVAGDLGERFVCFLNTESRVLAQGWLHLLRRAAGGGEGVGIAGATGSYESMFSDSLPWLKPVRSRQFSAFPNPHVRTNAFMLPRDVLMTLEWPLVRDKARAHRLESGRRGITRQVLDRGLRALLVARDGTTFDTADWPSSGTFRLGDQQRLLVADKRTDQYAQATGDRRLALARAAWGRAAPHDVPAR